MKCNIIKILFLASMLVHASTSLHASEYSPDGRMGTKCVVSRTVFKGKEVCRVSLAQLAITPERFQGKIVKTSGYFSGSNESIGVSEFGTNIWLEIKSDTSALKENSGKRVVVWGVYDALSFGHLDQWDGTITSPVIELMK